jgi:crossover junction endodeoxyribonuclease RuvC
MKILGIDPGTNLTGFGLIEKKDGKLICLDCGVIHTESGKPHPKRLLEIHIDLCKIIAKAKPQLVAIEKLFFFKNAKTAFTVGQARGVILLAAIKSKIKIVEPTPLQVKMAVCGNGRAAKEQVGEMVQKILNLEQIPKPDDAADALAIAIWAANDKKY